MSLPEWTERHQDDFDASLSNHLDAFQEEVSAWAAHNFPNAEPVDPLLGTSEEIGELSHAFLKKKQGIRGTAADHDAAMVDAVADTIIFLAHFCDLNGIDLGQALRTTWFHVRQRDWQADPLKGGKA